MRFSASPYTTPEGTRPPRGINTSSGHFEADEQTHSYA